MKKIVYVLILLSIFGMPVAKTQSITSAGMPAELLLQAVGNDAIRITLLPLSANGIIPVNPALANNLTLPPANRLRSVTGRQVKRIGNLTVSITASPLTIHIVNKEQQLVQRLVFKDDKTINFILQPNEKVLGMGEGGPKPERGKNWRNQPVQFDRRGSLDSMQPRWQGDAYGSRNPAAVLAGTSGWGLFVAAPWVLVDLRAPASGSFIPWQLPVAATTPQNQRNQGMNMGKGLPPATANLRGYFDVFVFDAHDPSRMMQNFSCITGPAVMPPKWALGYMQSHRTLETDAQLTGIADTFRLKKIPIDAVIYLGTGFTPTGWNKMQPSFEFNPQVFKREPVSVINALHKNKVKVVLHMVPWDRDSLPTLQGSIPAKEGELLNSSHIANYWKQHEPLFKTGVDAFWPDEGDWFNLHERIKRHQLYYQGPLYSQPNTRPWSLHRNGYPGIAQWGGWVWSGDTESSWKTLEAQIAVGINYSLSVAPFWGSDIGGFYPSEEYTGEMYVRWHQLASFNASFRSHGRTWWLHLPWGWGRSGMGPKENKANPLPTAMNDLRIEPVIKQYNELRYRLMPYTYTLAWQARQTGMPMMRALWLHYPGDEDAAGTGDQFLWGRDILVAPVYENDARIKKLYLPAGDWYDWWTNEKITGGGTIERAVDLATLPLYVRAGAIIPVDTIRQHTADTVAAALTIKVYSGAPGKFVLYEDDGISQEYLKGNSHQTAFTWDDNKKRLVIAPVSNQWNGHVPRSFNIEWIAEKRMKKISYTGKKVTVQLP